MSQPFEVAGHIKWFDAGRGFGFIAPYDNLPDAFLHVSRLLESGYDTAPTGATVLCEAVHAGRGLRVVRVLSMDTSTAREPRLSNAVTVVKPESEWERATVKWFDRVRGFGFLGLDAGGADVFVHMETLRCCHFLEGLRPPQAVEVRWGTGPKGRVAAEIRPAR